MLKVLLPTSTTIVLKDQRGISLVEVLLAVAVFGFLTTAVIGAIVYGRSATASNNNRQTANLLADEGLEAVRNIRDNGFANLADGTYGVTQSGNQWVLSGSSDTNSIFTRSVTIASAGADRKNVTSTVNWNQGAQGSASTSLITRLTNWTKALRQPGWTTPALESSFDAASTNDGLKIATQGNYAYLVRNDGTPDFMIFNISNPAASTLAGSLSLTGAPTNIFVSGNYAYVTSTNDSGELYIINITNPAAPSLSGTYNAAGTGNGLGIYVVGSVAYLTRAADTANEELIIVNVATPSSPARLTGYGGINANMNEVYVDTNTIYIATSSDTQEMVEIVYSSGALGTPAVVNLSGTADALTITGYGKTLILGQGSLLYTIDGGVTNTILGSVSLGGTVNDVTLNGTNSIVFAGTSSATAEFQVVSIGTLSSPTVAGSVDVTGTTALNGVAYNGGLDRVPATGSSDTQELLIFKPN